MKKIYKIRHKASGKFVRIKLKIQGVKGWKEKDVINGHPGFGKVLFDTHKGWATPPEPSNEDFNEIGCEVVVYNINETEL